MFRKIIIATALCAVSNTFAVEINYTWEEGNSDWSAPIIREEAYPIMITGAAMTAALLLNRDSVVEPFQERISTEKPLGKWAEFGDLMGQLIPNVIYMGAMYADYKYSNSDTSLNRSVYMLKTSAYSGLTTTILKNLVREKRPSGSDNLSFPSGHTTTAFAFASVVAMEHEWYWGLGAYGIASLVGFSRINDNAHYLHDVVMGATIGISYGVALYYSEHKSKGNTYPIFMDDGMGIGTTITF